MSGSKLQQENRRKAAVSHEESIINFFAKYPDRKPDGSFVMSMYLQGFRDGRADMRRAARRSGGL